MRFKSKEHRYPLSYTNVHYGSGALLLPRGAALLVCSKYTPRACAISRYVGIQKIPTNVRRVASAIVILCSRTLQMYAINPNPPNFSGGKLQNCKISKRKTIRHIRKTISQIIENIWEIVLTKSDLVLSPLFYSFLYGSLG